MALVAALGGLLLGALPSGAHGATTATLHPRHAMLTATNTSRYNHALHRVWINRDMSQLAKKHSLAMANSNTLFHTSDPARYYLNGTKWHTWGENVGVTAEERSGRWSRRSWPARPPREHPEPRVPSRRDRRRCGSTARCGSPSSSTADPSEPAVRLRRR